MEEHATSNPHLVHALLISHFFCCSDQTATKNNLKGDLLQLSVQEGIQSLIGGRQGGRSVKRLITWHPQIGRREYTGHWTRHETSRSSFPFLKVLQHLQRVPAAEDQLLKHMSLCRRGSPSNHKDNRISWVLRLFRITRTKSGVCGLNHTIYFHHSLSSASTPPPRSSLSPYPLCSIWTWISRGGGTGLMTRGDTLETLKRAEHGWRVSFWFSDFVWLFSHFGAIPFTSG